MGLYGTDFQPRYSYQATEEDGAKLRKGETVKTDGVSYTGIDIVLNCFSVDEIKKQLPALKDRKTVKIMIHEQYYYMDTDEYQPDFTLKVETALSFLTANGFTSRFFEELI